MLLHSCNALTGTIIMHTKVSNSFQFCLCQALLVIIGLHESAGLEFRYVTSHGRPHIAYRYHSSRRLVTLIKSSQDDSIENDEASGGKLAGTTVKVSYEGQSCTIKVFPNESILSALERQSIDIQSHLTALPEMPSDCRRGNCMTCAGRIMNDKNSPTSSGNYDEFVVRTDDNGLSPTISKMIADQGYLLTCSSFVRPPRNDDSSATSTPSNILQIELGVHNEIWNEVYDKRFTSPETQLVARAAMARVVRQSAERNPHEWKRSTERLLRQTETE